MLVSVISCICRISFRTQIIGFNGKRRERRRKDQRAANRTVSSLPLSLVSLTFFSPLSLSLLLHFSLSFLTLSLCLPPLSFVGSRMTFGYLAFDDPARVKSSPKDCHGIRNRKWVLWSMGTLLRISGFKSTLGFFFHGLTLHFCGFYRVMDRVLRIFMSKSYI